jgi:hypothetical protein
LPKAQRDAAPAKSSRRKDAAPRLDGWAPREVSPFHLRENHHPLFQGNHSYTFLKHTLAFALRRYLAEGPYLADNTSDVGDAANGRTQGVWRVGCI